MHGVFPRLWADTAGGIQRGSNPECLPEDILPLCTHEGSGMGRSEADIQAACPGAKVEKGLAVTGGRVAQAENDIRKWLERYGF